MSLHIDGTNCEVVLDQLEAWIDDDLEASAAIALKRHLETCAGCRGEAALARTIRNELREMPRLDTPSAVLERVHSEVNSERSVAASSRWGSFRTPPVWLAAAAVFAAVALAPRFFAPGAEEVAAVETAAEPIDAAAVERATEEARVALAYVSQVSRRTALEIRDDLILGRVVFPTAESLSRLKGMRHGRVGESNET
jgi:anti-sigma factor RsiW